MIFWHIFFCQQFFMANSLLMSQVPHQRKSVPSKRLSRQADSQGLQVIFICSRRTRMTLQVQYIKNSYKYLISLMKIHSIFTPLKRRVMGVDASVPDDHRCTLQRRARVSVRAREEHTRNQRRNGRTRALIRCLPAFRSLPFLSAHAQGRHADDVLLHRREDDSRSRAHASGGRSGQRHHAPGASRHGEVRQPRLGARHYRGGFDHESQPPRASSGSSI